MPDQNQQTHRVPDPILLCIGLSKNDNDLRVNWLPVFRQIHYSSRADSLERIVRKENADALAVNVRNWADFERVRGLRNGGVNLPILLVSEDALDTQPAPELKCTTIVLSDHAKKDLPAAFEAAMNTAHLLVKPLEE